MATESEVIYEGYFYKLCGHDKKVFGVHRYSWKERYILLIRRGEKAMVEYFDKKPKTTDEVPRGSLDLHPSFNVLKAEKKNKQYACEICVGTKKLILAADSELDRDCLTFHVQTQARLKDDIENEAFGVRPDSSEDNRKIGARGSMCYLHVSEWGVTLALQVSKSILAQWPLSCIRCYECLTNNKFSIESGRRSPMGQGQYVFSTRPGHDQYMYKLLDHFVMKAAGLLEESPDLPADEVERQMVSEYDHLHLLTNVQSDGMFSKQLHRISRDNYDHLVLRNRGLESKDTSKKKSEAAEALQEDTISTSSSQEYHDPAPQGGSTSKPDLIRENPSLRDISTSHLTQTRSLAIPGINQDRLLGATGGQEPRAIPTGRPVGIKKYPSMQSSNSESSDLGPDQYLSFSPSTSHPSPTTPGSEDFMSPPPSFSELSQYSYGYSPEHISFMNKTYQNESKEKRNDFGNQKAPPHQRSPVSNNKTSALRPTGNQRNIERTTSQTQPFANQKETSNVQSSNDGHHLISDEYLTPGSNDDPKRGLKKLIQSDPSQEYLMASDGHQVYLQPQGGQSMVTAGQQEDYLMPGSKKTREGPLTEYLMPGSKDASKDRPEEYLMPGPKGHQDTYLLASSKGHSQAGLHGEYMLPNPCARDRPEYLAMASDDQADRDYSKEDYLNPGAEVDDGYGDPNSEDYLLATDFHYMSPQSGLGMVGSQNLRDDGFEEDRRLEANTSALASQFPPGSHTKTSQQAQTVLELKKMFSLKKANSNSSLGDLDFSGQVKPGTNHAPPNMTSVKPASRFPPHPSRKGPKVKDSAIVPSAQSKSFKKPSGGSLTNEMPGLSSNETPSNIPSNSFYPSHMAPTTSIGETLC